MSAAGVTVFEPTGTPYHTFRIPALLAIPDPDGPVLLAFCEGRVESSGDSGPIELVLRRSVDGGRSWLPLQLVCRAAERTCGNPVPILDPATGDVVLLTTRNGARVAEPELARGLVDPDETRRIYVQRSTDRGETWTEPVEITDQVRPAGWSWYATGPCHGIALRYGDHPGRLVAPANHSVIPPADGAEPGRGGLAGYLGGHCILSDDGGRSWRVGFVHTPLDDDTINPNETTVAELADGRLIFNARNFHGSAGRRLQAVSRDGGESLETPYAPCPGVTAPDVQGSLLSPDGKLLLLSTPARPDARRELTIFVSTDTERWRRAAVITDGYAGYSDLALLDGDRIGVLYETGANAANEEIVFTVSTLADLIDADDRDARPGRPDH